MKSISKRIGLFPGTFDPITIGHQDIINRSLPLFDKLFIGIGRNVNKEPMFSVEQRLEWIRAIYTNNPKVEAVAFDGLTIRCCQEVGANFILRGIRYVNDFEYEKAIADMNRSLDNNIETVFLTCLPNLRPSPRHWSATSSRTAATSCSSCPTWSRNPLPAPRHARRKNKKTNADVNLV